MQLLSTERLLFGTVAYVLEGVLRIFSLKFDSKFHIFWDFGGSLSPRTPSRYANVSELQNSL